MELTKDIYTTREAAHIAGLIPATITTAIRQGDLKAGRFGTSYVIEKKDLQDYLERRKERS